MPPDTLKLDVEGSTSLTARVGDLIWVEEYTAEDESGKVTVSLLTFDKAKLALVGSDGGEVFGGGKRWNNIYFEVLKPGPIRLKLDFRFADYEAGEEYSEPIVFEIVAE
jgi:hypothetical protein